MTTTAAASAKVEAQPAAGAVLHWQALEGFRECRHELEAEKRLAARYDHPRFGQEPWDAGQPWKRICKRRSPPNAAS